MKRRRRPFAAGMRYYHRQHELQRLVGWDGRWCSQFSLFPGPPTWAGGCSYGCPRALLMIACYRRRRLLLANPRLRGRPTGIGWRAGDAAGLWRSPYGQLCWLVITLAESAETCLRPGDVKSVLRRHLWVCLDVVVMVWRIGRVERDPGLHSEPSGSVRNAHGRRCER